MNKLLKKTLIGIRKLPLLIESRFDGKFLASDVPMSRMVSHQKWQKYLYEIGNKPGMRVLEIGSREVTGSSNARKEFTEAKYVGFDYYPGDNVDVVGDAHKLSTGRGASRGSSSASHTPCSSEIGRASCRERV